MSSDRYASAAQAYERFLQHFANSEYAGDVHLMLGLLYGRYLQERDRARTALAEAIRRLKDPRKMELAEAELAALGPRE
jgi:TolA-binding protein